MVQGNCSVMFTEEAQENPEPGGLSYQVGKGLEEPALAESSRLSGIDSYTRGQVGCRQAANLAYFFAQIDFPCLNCYYTSHRTLKFYIQKTRKEDDYQKSESQT